jgi:Icc-related predicted phosphoesterase
MKIYAFVDLHGDILALKHVISASKSADILVCAGDLSNFEQNLGRLIEQLSSLKKKCIIIPGNHESPDELKEVCSRYDDIVYLHKGVLQLEGVTFIGYGGGGFSLMDKEFERFAEKVKPHIKGKLVLITHAPPHGTAVDDIYGEHRGNRSIRSFIASSKPVLAICGHLHENSGIEDTIGKTRIINPGKKGKIVIV